MVVANTLRSLQVYDILANLLPGAMLLVVFTAAVHVEDYVGSFPPSLLITVFIVIGFVLGHVIQALASKLNGKPRLFGLLVAETRDVEPYKPDGTLEMLPPRIRGWLGFRRASVADLRITEVEEEFWELAKSHFDLCDDFEDHGRLLQLILSYLETVPATRALRFQSIHTFHRSMWAAWLLSLGLIIGVGIGTSLDLVRARSPALLVFLGLASLFGIWIFGRRKEKFNKKFVEYAILDFYTQQKAQ